jgi:hypothetical protein
MNVRKIKNERIFVIAKSDKRSNLFIHYIDNECNKNNNNC